jgi:prepilin-type N-terminal cleavage/methylation domain-containing protein
VKRSRPSPRAFAAGFTLLELLVSSALIGIVMMILLMTTTGSISIWRGSENAIAVDREGRNALTLISDDLANMLPVATDAPEYMLPRFAVWNDLVFMEFLVLRPRDYQAPDEGNNGDLCYVRYRYRDNKIERATADSAQTFAELREGRRPAPENFEVLSENLPRFYIGTYGTDGRKLNPEGNAGDIRAVHLVDVSLAAVDLDEMEARRKGIEARERGTSLEMLSSMQYFSTCAYVPRP